MQALCGGSRNLVGLLRFVLRSRDYDRLVEFVFEQLTGDRPI